MKTSIFESVSRRDLITKWIPTCTAACLMSPAAFAFERAASSPLFQEAKHKFDQEFTFGRPISQRQFITLVSRNAVQLGKTMVEELGEEKTVEILKKNTSRQMFARGKMDAKRNKDDSFQSYINIFRNPRMLGTLTMDIIQDTDTVFEIRVTECLSNAVYRSLDFAGKFGFACVCHGDYAWAEGYNPKIKLVRDKTLMEGDDYCNHRYMWTG